jgi:hypothetical protein
VRLRTISEEAYISYCHDHQRLILKKMGQRNVSEDVDIERSESDKNNKQSPIAADLLIKLPE